MGGRRSDLVKKREFGDLNWSSVEQVNLSEVRFLLPYRFTRIPHKDSTIFEALDAEKGRNGEGEKVEESQGNPKRCSLLCT